MHVDSTNLNNMTQLWQLYGAGNLYEDAQLQLHMNISWPNRVWAGIAKPVSEQSLQQAAKYAPESASFPLWPTMTEDGSAAPQETVDALLQKSKSWEATIQLTAMALQLDKISSGKTKSEAQYPIHIKCLSKEVDIEDWVLTGSNAFGYTIDAKVIVPLLLHDDIQILLGYNEDSQPVATGLLFKTDNVVGIHQVGVPANFQGKGYATQMMKFLIQSAENWQADYVVLQASEAGRPVYRKLGFVDQFLITYLQRYKI